MTTITKKNAKTDKATEIALYIGKLFSFNNSLKLFHWHISGEGSYSQHIALDQAIESLIKVTDRIVETTYAVKGDLNITIPETKTPINIIEYITDFYVYVESARILFSETFTQAIIDDYQEAIQQLLYRMKRLQ